ncbi:MAG: (2Fe-2S)-binding protein [Calditrichaeota bacterium]|nr:MAG: (2Fe-2S)-binding protein [Calditrichota bacterium]
MPVTRCVCFNKKFSELKKIAKANNCSSLEELQEKVTFGENCKRCHPYVKKMFETGETVFEVLPVENSD